MWSEGELQFVKINVNASAPTKGSEASAGFDLTSAEDVSIKAHGRSLVSTGLRLRLPERSFGRISPRSGLALRHGLDVGAGIIDNDYRGEIFVLLFNHGDEDYLVKVGDRVAQIIVSTYRSPVVREVQELDETVRAHHGFGSTGI